MGKVNKCLFLRGCYLPVDWLEQLGGSAACVCTSMKVQVI